jgi:ribosome-binding factor A
MFQPFNEKMKHRMLRVNEVVKRELSGIIAREMTFEGALVSINHVDVTPDLKNAHVFVSVLGTEARESVMSKLASHRPALQAELARHVTMKYTPHLIFHLDDSIERGTRVIEIMQEIEASQGEKK